MSPWQDFQTLDTATLSRSRPRPMGANIAHARSARIEYLYPGTGANIVLKRTIGTKASDFIG